MSRGFRHPDLIEPFVWGPVVGVHEIGDHVIVEYRPQIFKGSVGTGKYETEKTQFHVLGRSHSADSIDEALITAIALKYDGINTRAHMYFYRMVDMGGKR